jgi:hypothetical protein
VNDRLFVGEEAVLHLMGEQIASEKRRNRGCFDTTELGASYATTSSWMSSRGARFFGSFWRRGETSRASRLESGTRGCPLQQFLCEDACALIEMDA